MMLRVIADERERERGKTTNTKGPKSIVVLLLLMKAQINSNHYVNTI